MKNQAVIITVVLVIVVAVAGFFAGMQYQKSKTPFLGQNQTFARRFGAQNNPGGGAKPVIGRIISEDSGSITVKSPDGSSKIVLLSDSTSVTESTSSSKQALKEGQQVLVVGTTDSTGSVTAQSIQINPQQMRMFGRGG